MRCERFTFGGDPVALAARVRSLVPAAQTVSAAVAEIIGRVREQGDEALLGYTRMLDTGGGEPPPIRVATPQLTAAADALEPSLREGLELAIANVRRVAEAQLVEDRTVEFGSHAVAVREVALETAAVYVPGGRAPYPSTVVMGVVTARAAGVKEVVVCSPPRREGDVHPAVLGAAALAGASAAYRMGGAQAVAALAYGSESVAGVEAIVGPGNLYVQEAKRQVCGQVAIDGFAGPSDLVVIAGEGAAVHPIALDLLAQAEHGAGTLVAAISADPELLGQLRQRLEQALQTGAVACLLDVPNIRAALALAQALAPEHVELVGRDAEALSDRVTTAGGVFVGESSATAFGDYVAGSNHILPTGGSARFASALSPAAFRRRFYEVRVTDAGQLARAGAAVARAEGFERHAESMEARAEQQRRADDHP